MKREACKHQPYCDCKIDCEIRRVLLARRRLDRLDVVIIGSQLLLAAVAIVIIAGAL